MTLQKINRRHNNSLNGFDSFFNDFFQAPTHSTKTDSRKLVKSKSIPSVNIREAEKSFHIDLAVPGMNKADFKIEIEENKMTISSESESKEKEEMDNYARMEFNYSSFSRSFTLPENIEETKVSAKYEDGVLKVMIPKSKEQELKDKTTVVKIS